MLAHIFCGYVDLWWSEVEMSNHRELASQNEGSVWITSSGGLFRFYYFKPQMHADIRWSIAEVCDLAEFLQEK